MDEGRGIDVARARRETPGCERVVHLNNAGSALPPAPVLASVADHLRLESEIGGYEAEADEHERIEGVYDSLAALLGCSREEIAVVESATRAWDMAFYSFGLRPGDRVLTTRSEYASNYIALKQVADRTGASVEPIPNDDDGQVDVHALASMLDGRVRLVSLVHVPTQGGLVNPAAEVGAITRAAGIPLLLDACQSVGQMPLDVQEIGCDMLSATGRKFLRGPRGTGFLYVRRELIEGLEPPFLDLHSAEWLADGGYRIRADARRFEQWEASYALRLGLGAAVEYASGWGLEAIWARVSYLATRLRELLGDIPGVQIRDLGEQRCAIVSFSVAERDPQEIARTLGSRGINVSVISRNASRFDLDERDLDELLRASVHYYNDDSDLDALVEGVGEIARG
jgi:selenocysteine lyase/cysteine desulfurase